MVMVAAVVAFTIVHGIAMGHASPSPEAAHSDSHPSTPDDLTHAASVVCAAAVVVAFALLRRRFGRTAWTRTRFWEVRRTAWTPIVRQRAVTRALLFEVCVLRA